MGKKEAVPMRRYAGSTGRCAQGRFGAIMSRLIQWCGLRLVGTIATLDGGDIA
jgi:hypothetical protein